VRDMKGKRRVPFCATPHAPWHALLVTLMSRSPCHPHVTLTLMSPSPCILDTLPTEGTHLQGPWLRSLPPPRPPFPPPHIPTGARGHRQEAAPHRPGRGHWAAAGQEGPAGPPRGHQLPAAAPAVPQGSQARVEEQLLLLLLLLLSFPLVHTYTHTRTHSHTPTGSTRTASYPCCAGSSASWSATCSA